MSEFFRNKGIKKLSPTARYLVDYSTNCRHSDSLALAMRKQYYRAALEVLFVRHRIEVVVSKPRDHVCQRTFKDYVRTVVKKLGLSEDLIHEADIIDSCDTRDVLSSIVTQVMCARVIESLILLDRWMAVQETVDGGYVGMHRIFNPEISPGGLAIVASR
jgi:hypothetical protein